MTLRFLFVAVAAACLPSTAFAAPPQAAPAAERFSVVVEGRGPDVILIPGLASSRDVWAEVAGRLKTTHRVHLVQVAGFAGEPAAGDGAVVAPLADALAAYAGRERLRAPAVIGHSLGGETALMLAARHPRAIGRVMVVDALPFYPLIFDRAATSTTVAPQAAAMRDAMLAMPPAQRGAMQEVAMARLVKTAAARPALVAAGLRSDAGTVARATHELMTTDLRPELPRIAAPVTVVYAYDAAYGTPGAAVDALYRDAYAGLRGVRLERIDGAFHFVMLDQAAAFAAAVDRFLR